MKLEEFIKKYDGKKVEAGGSAGAEWQCVDLANQYISEVLGLPKILWTNAKDFPLKAGDKYDYFKNTPLGVPEKGDLVIWCCSTYGHIAIFLSGDVNWFTSFDQNWPLNSSCHKVDHAYTNVVGWMRPKGEPMTNELSECLKAHTKLMEEIKNKDELISTQANDLLTLKTEKDNLIDERDDARDNFEKAEELRKKWYDQLQVSKTNLDSCSKDRASFAKRLTEIETKLIPQSKWWRKIYDFVIAMDEMYRRRNKVA